MTKLTHADFTKPSPGAWTFDQTHQTHPHPRLVQPILERGMDNGFRGAFENVGALLDLIETRHVHGWCYQAIRPIGAPPEAKGPPPRLLFKLALKLHPKLRKRVRRAHEIWTDKPWRVAAERWDGLEDDYRQQLIALQTIDRSAASTEALTTHLAEAVQLAQLLFTEHMLEATPAGIPIGDLFVQADTHGIPVTHSCRILSGACPEATRPTRMMLTIVESLRESGGLGLLDEPDVHRVMEQLDAHPHAGGPLRAYLQEYGYRALEFHIDAAETLVERPDLTVGTLRGLRTHVHLPTTDPGLKAAAEIRSDLPEEVRAWWDEAVAEAREATRNRDTTANFAGWGFGLVRHFALVLGQRLHTEGRLPSPQSIFHITAEELDALPDATELKRREAAHVAASQIQPPRHLGTPGKPPPTEWLPAPSARLERAVMAYISRFDAGPDLVENDELRGLGVSEGVVAGQVFVLHDLDHQEAVPAGCILVTWATNPTLNPVLPIIDGLVTEVGGLISHAAIMSRELGFPGVVGCAGATSRLKHGSWVEIDGSTGQVTVLDGPVEKTHAPRTRHEAQTIQPRMPEHKGAWAELNAADDIHRFGGKAARLATAVVAGHRVPPGVALDVDFVEAVAAGDAGHIASLEAAISGLSGPLAVRSSAPAEDGSSASFAGMHHTELGVAAGDVPRAVAAVWQSGVAPAAQAYRARMGVEGRPQMAVLIQELLPADASGVRFGRDPVTGEDIRILECAPGLGALVVDGRVTPDRVRLDAAGQVIERSRGDTPIKLVPGAAGGVEEVPTSAAELAAGPLENGILASVYALGEACDALFDGAQDVEWAIVRDEVWLLQSRPVTTGGGA